MLTIHKKTVRFAGGKRTSYPESHMDQIKYMNKLAVPVKKHLDFEHTSGTNLTCLCFTPLTADFFRMVKLAQVTLVPARCVIPWL